MLGINEVATYALAKYRIHYSHKCYYDKKYGWFWFDESHNCQTHLLYSGYLYDNQPSEHIKIANLYRNGMLYSELKIFTEIAKLNVMYVHMISFCRFGQCIVYMTCFKGEKFYGYII